MITLNIENKTIELATHEVSGKELYKAQDLLKGYYGEESKATSRQKLKDWQNSYSKKVGGNFHPTQITTGANDIRGTYITKREILKLAGYVSYEFEDAVYEAFEALSEARTEDALEATAKVINIRPALKSGKKLKPLLDEMRAFSAPDPVSFTKLVLEQSTSLTDVEFDKLVKTMGRYLAENYLHHYALCSAMLELKHRKADRYSRAAKLRK